MEFAWNKLIAEDIRQQNATAMQGTHESIVEQSWDYLKEAEELEREAAALEATLPIYRTVRRQGEYREVIDHAATAAGWARVRDLRDRARRLREAARNLREVARGLNEAITSSNRTFDRLHNEVVRTDQDAAASMRAVREGIVAFNARMGSIRDSIGDDLTTMMHGSPYLWSLVEGGTTNIAIDNGAFSVVNFNPSADRSEPWSPMGWLNQTLMGWFNQTLTGQFAQTLRDIENERRARVEALQNEFEEKYAFYSQGGRWKELVARPADQISQIDYHVLASILIQLSDVEMGEFLSITSIKAGDFNFTAFDLMGVPGLRPEPDVHKWSVWEPDTEKLANVASSLQIISNSMQQMDTFLRNAWGEDPNLSGLEGTLYEFLEDLNIQRKDVLHRYALLHAYSGICSLRSVHQASRPFVEIGRTPKMINNDYVGSYIIINYLGQGRSAAQRLARYRKTVGPTIVGFDAIQAARRRIEIHYNQKYGMSSVSGLAQSTIEKKALESFVKATAEGMAKNVKAFVVPIASGVINTSFAVMKNRKDIADAHAVVELINKSDYYKSFDIYSNTIQIGPRLRDSYVIINPGQFTQMQIDRVNAELHRLEINQQIDLSMVMTEPRTVWHDVVYGLLSATQRNRVFREGGE